MKKTLLFLLSTAICLSFVCFFTSCSDSEKTLNETTESITRTENITSGQYNDTINWKYDESSRTFAFSGTGKIEKNGNLNIDNHGNYWTAVTENIIIEEGITDIENAELYSFDFAKTLHLPSSFIGNVPDLKNIEKYVVAENNKKYSSDENGVLFNYGKTEILRYPKANPAEVYKIPDGVTNIIDGAFDDSKHLKAVIIPESLNDISKTIFDKSSIYSNPENWENDILYVDTCLVKVDWETTAEHIIVKDGTKTISTHAFYGCENIKSITIPDSVKEIGDGAFISCASLERIYIGSGVESIGGAPFVFDVEGLPCGNLKIIEVSRDNKYYTSVDGVLFNKEMTELIQYPIGKKQKEYVIPDSVTKIGNGAFFYCKELIKLTIGKGVSVIERPLLFHCENIETVILPDTLTKLDGGAFKYSGIKHIDIPDSVTYLGCEAMTGCERLETVNIGKGVSYIHEWAIWSPVLKSVNVDSENEHFTDVDGVLFNKDKTELWLYPPNKIGEEYHIPESVKTIKYRAIMQAENLKKIYVGSGIERIEESNFYKSPDDSEPEYVYKTSYEIIYDGTQRQWNKLFTSEYEREYIDKEKIKYLK